MCRSQLSRKQSEIQPGPLDICSEEKRTLFDQQAAGFQKIEHKCPHWCCKLPFCANVCLCKIQEVETVECCCFLCNQLHQGTDIHAGSSGAGRKKAGCLAIRYTKVRGANKSYPTQTINGKTRAQSIGTHVCFLPFDQRENYLEIFFFFSLHKQLVCQKKRNKKRTCTVHVIAHLRTPETRLLQWCCSFNSNSPVDLLIFLFRFPPIIHKMVALVQALARKILEL